MKVTAQGIQQDAIISGQSLVFGRRVERGQIHIIQVGYSTADTGGKENNDASDPTRANALFLVLRVTEHENALWAKVVRLSDDLDYSDKSERLEFRIGADVNAVAELEHVGVARTNDSIRPGDAIQSAKFASPDILQPLQNGRTAPSGASRFVVQSVEDGDEDDRRFITAFQLNDDNSWGPDSTRVEFFMSDNDSWTDVINCVKLIGIARQFSVDLVAPL